MTQKDSVMSSFERTYPEYAAIEAHIRAARIERSLAVARMIAGLAEKVSRGLRGLAHSFRRGLEAERDRRAIEADAFLKRSVPRY